MTIKISKDFSKAPGPRYESEGTYSGEEFRKNVLLPRVKEAIATGVTLTIDFDGTYGFGTSFLEEAFGGLIRDDKIPLKSLKAVLRFVSDEEPTLVREIEEYMEDASEIGSRPNA